MKILFMTAECSKDLSWSNMYYLEQAIGKIAECKWAGHGHELHVRGEDLNDTVRRVMPDADWVIIHDKMHTKFKYAVRIPKKRICKVAYSTSDLHNSPPLRLKEYNDGNWDAFLMQVTQTAIGYGPTGEGRPLMETNPTYFLDNLNAPTFFMALSINPELFKPLGQPKEHDVTFLGAHHMKYYPLRAWFWQDLPILAEFYGWKLLIRGTPPGVSLVSRNIDELLARGYIVGEKYAEVLALSKIFIFSGGRVRYPVKKYFEGMACGTCVFADTPLTAEELHFIPDWNFVEINNENWSDKILYYLEHDEEREKIARRGYETVMKYHTNSIRAQELIKFLEECS